MNTGIRLLKVAAMGSLLGVLAAGASAAVIPVKAAPKVPAVTGTSLVKVLHNVPATLSKAKLLGHHNPSASFDIVLALHTQNVTQLDEFMREQTDPSSLNYRHFLNSQEFKALYAPTNAQVSSVESFLHANGIVVDKVSDSNRFVFATATGATLERAFHVTINDYSYLGATIYSESADPSIPAGLGSLVMSVMGLDNAVNLTEHMRPPVAGPETASATSRLGPSGFSPIQIATAYGWPQGVGATPLVDTNLATGATIAILTAYNFKMSDVTHFWAQYGLPSHSVTLIPVGGTTRRLNGETTLDIERSSSMSPGSTILVYSTPTPSLTGFTVAMDQIVSDDSADIVTTSWGSPESASGFVLTNVEAVEDETFKAAVAHGMVVLAAAGDNGASDGANGKDNADFPSSDPFIIAAGGTRLVLDGNNNITSEKAWTDAGGADSVIFGQPAYQGAFANNGACSADTATNGGIDSVSACGLKGDASRQSSDMSMDADPGTGYSIFYNGRWAEFGGTSFVAPELAGLFAIAKTRKGARLGSGTLGTGSQGFGGPSLIYCVANGLNYATDFNDITSGANSPTLGGSFDASTAPGWDHPTGWGTPKDANALITDIVGCAL